MQRGVAANVMIVLMSLIGSTNYFAQFIPGLNYRPDPMVTLFFLGMAGTVIGVKGLGLGIGSKKGGDGKDDQK